MKQNNNTFCSFDTSMSCFVMFQGCFVAKIADYEFLYCTLQAVPTAEFTYVRSSTGSSWSREGSGWLACILQGIDPCRSRYPNWPRPPESSDLRSPSEDHRYHPETQWNYVSWLDNNISTYWMESLQKSYYTLTWIFFLLLINVKHMKLTCIIIIYF